ncbi:MAG: L-lactate permease [Kiritimatiellae bacterium]|nr:L-lactate permease [Kiritimatiellia bacterium]
MNLYSALLSFIPVAVLIVALTFFKLPAWRAALAALCTGAVEAMLWRGLGAGEIASCLLQGTRTGLYPIGLVIVAALFTYGITVESKAIDEIKHGLSSLSSDKCFLALLIAWGFGNFMEGMAGFGTAVAIPCALLAGIGFDPMKAVLCCLVANTTPTAFGSVGVPTMVLAGETGTELAHLTATIAYLELAPTALSPFLILAITDGWKGLKSHWKLALLADLAFILPWLGVASTLSCELPNIIGGICAMVALGFAGNKKGLDLHRQLWAWLPFAFVVAFLALNAVAPVGHKPSPGIVILLAAFAGGLCQKLGPARLASLFLATLRRYALAITTICAVLSLAKIMGAAGMTNLLAQVLVEATGDFYSAVSPAIGALGGFVTGSGTSSNVLFGSLQASAAGNEAERLLFAAANVMGAGIGKMICPQSIVLGCAAAGLAGRENAVMAKVAKFFVLVLAIACATTLLFAFA